VRITVYPDAHHGFDSPRQGPPIRIPNVGLGRRGATVGPNPSAREHARANVRRELAEIFGG
jgi:dienelactone hydrolase